MGKNKETATAPGLASEVVSALTEGQKAILGSMDADGVAELSTMTIEEVQQTLDLIASLGSSANMAGDVEFVDAKPEREDIAILTAGSAALRAGTKIRAYLLGTVHIFSKSMKENWKEFKTEKQLYFYNSYYKFRDMNGKEFGIWASPTLRVLEKIPTHASTPALVAQDPLVEISYFGKIEGKERLKQEFGLELSKGNAAHVFTVRVPANVKVQNYIKGSINSLNSPVPVESSADTSVSREEATRQNYEKLMALQGGDQGVAGILAQ
jgi:hypothetical protein